MPLPAEMGREYGIAFYRRELEKQRDLLRGIWKWYLGPLIPGLALFVSLGHCYGSAGAPPVPGILRRFLRGIILGDRPAESSRRLSSRSPDRRIEYVPLVARRYRSGSRLISSSSAGGPLSSQVGAQAQRETYAARSADGGSRGWNRGPVVIFD
jgi:hypothetical protein